jgi:hypothetical protein
LPGSLARSDGVHIIDSRFPRFHRIKDFLNDRGPIQPKLETKPLSDEKGGALPEILYPPIRASGVPRTLWTARQGRRPMPRRRTRVPPSCPLPARRPPSPPMLKST